MYFNICPEDLQNFFELHSDVQLRAGIQEQVAKALLTNLEGGIDTLDEKQLLARKEIFGENTLPERKKKRFWEFMVDALSDVTLIVLIVCGILSLILGLTIEKDKTVGWIEGASILVAVLIVVLISSLNDFQKEKQFRELSAIKDDVIVSVTRNFKRMQIPAKELLVGDLLHLSTGDIVTADGLLLKGYDVKVDNSSLTGESEPVEKSPNEDPVIYSGTKILAGYGILLVCAVGVRSQTGIIHRLVSSNASISAGKKRTSEHKESEPTGESTHLLSEEHKYSSSSSSDVSEPDESVIEGSGSVLQKKLEDLAVRIGYFGMMMAVLTFLILVIRFCIKTYTVRRFDVADLAEFLKFFIVGITVLVVAVPEGLPLAVTIALAFSVKRMLRDKNLVRHLDACETMGSATTICSDKTGTLTTNQMTVAACEFAHVQKDCLQYDKAPLGRTSKDIVEQIASVNSTAEVLIEDDGRCEYLGSSTECALLYFLRVHNIDYAKYRKTCEVAKLVTFSSARKRMSTIIYLPQEEIYRVLCKGAGEVVLGRCAFLYREDTGKGPLTPELRDYYQQRIDDYAQKGLRTLTFAYKDLSKETFEARGANTDFVESSLIFMGIVGIKDPVRPEVVNAIKQCQKAGIVVRMVTGDNVLTACTIAKECGILDADYSFFSVMEGPDFRNRVTEADGVINMRNFNMIWPHLRVLARSSPQDKYVLVDGLIRADNGGRQIVAVTGDGTNDAPALKRAHVGFAMGIQGTEVAKEASDIILMDDNFNSIVSAVKWGRNIYDSVSKFLQFQLTVNVVAILVAVVSSAVIETSPLTAVQMLWINLIMDSLASLALATEPPSAALLSRKPYRNDKPIVTGKMIRFIVGHSLYQCLIVFGTIFLFRTVSAFVHVIAKTPTTTSAQQFYIPDSGLVSLDKPTVHFTMVFNLFVLLQLVNEINARKIHGELNVFSGLTMNWLYLVIMAAQLLCQLVIVQFGGKAFGVVPLSWYHWLMSGFSGTPTELTSPIHSHSFYIQDFKRSSQVL
ncbi:plasma membrane calcium-transporting ATPase 3-like isoform X3 [Zophobas morio]|uniref:plasma membrane calcium-transporting ATPase 3-like isoform X3 n=2 Tax=Zophobas morio TaxID=2755281 RepID=UPI00308353B8